MRIKNWPKAERPRERLIKNGATHLSDGELLAILLRHGYQGKSALDIARQLLNQHGGLRGIFDLKFTDFCEMRGLGLAKYCQFQAALELGRRYLSEPLQNRQPISHSIEARNFLISRLRDYQQEVFAAMFLDTQNRLIEFEYLFYGTIHSASVYPREVVKRALYHNASKIIVAHNHPSGNSEPSTQDKLVTLKLKEALDLIEVLLVDHWVVGDCGATSLAERGILFS
jgi:DNA repair protein RadC